MNTSYFCFRKSYLYSLFNAQIYSRATAIISKTLEALPVLSVSVPIGFGLASKPDIIQNVMASSPLDRVPLLVTNLMDGSLWF